MGSELGVDVGRAQEVWKAANYTRDWSDRWAQLFEKQRAPFSYTNRQQDNYDLKMPRS